MRSTVLAMVAITHLTACGASEQHARDADAPPTVAPPPDTVAIVPLEDGSPDELAVAPNSIPESPAPPGPPPPPPLAGDPKDALTPPPPAFAKVDWLNREYLPGWLQLVAGRGEVREYSEDYGGMHDTTIWQLESVAYGDVTGDTTPEAAVLILEDWFGPEGGQRRSGLLFVFTATKSGRAQHVASSQAVPPGDRVAIEAGQVVVFTGPTRAGAWKINGDQLTPVP